MLQAGESVGPYVIRAYLKTGASSEVYEASAEDRLIALKILRDDKSHEPLLPWRMANEALALRQICHPGVVTLFSHDYYNGRPYLALELLHRSLAESLPVSPSQAVTIAESLASTLAALHAANIVHRDLKPQNVMLPEGGKPKLVDLGLAKLPVAAATAEAPLLPLSTEPGTFFGTYEYAAPEQIVDAKNVDGRADVYALGVILFEMLAGRRPFIAKERGRLVSMHLNTPPPVLSSLVRGLPLALVSLVSRMLAKQPEARPSADEVAAELARISFARLGSNRAWLLMSPLLLLPLYAAPAPHSVDSTLEINTWQFERTLYTGTVAKASAEFYAAMDAMSRHGSVTLYQRGIFRYREAALAKERGAIRESLRLYEDARAQWQPLIARQPGLAYKALSICADGIGEMHYHLGDYERTLSLYQDAAHTLPRTLAAAQSSRQVPSFIDYQRALVYRDQENEGAALAALEDAEEHERVLLSQGDVVAADSWQLARVLTLRAEISLKQDKKNEAWAAATEAEGLARKALAQEPSDKRYQLGYLLASERLNEVGIVLGQMPQPRMIDPLVGLRELVQTDPENGQWAHALTETLIKRAQRAKGDQQGDLVHEALTLMQQMESRGQWIDDIHLRRWRKLAANFSKVPLRAGNAAP